MALPSDAYPFPLSDHVALGANSVTLRVMVRPRGSAVMLYPAAASSSAILIDAPGRHVTIGYGSGTIYLQKTRGAQMVEVRVVGWD